MPPKTKNKAKTKPKSQPKQPPPKSASPVIPPHNRDQGQIDQVATPTVQRTLPCATYIKDDYANFYYPFGNSIPEDLFLHLDVFAPPGRLTHIDALLAGSGAAAGDLRHVLFTLSELRRKLLKPETISLGGIVHDHFRRNVATSSQPLPLNVHFHVNDHQSEVIARNILILHAISTWSGPVTPTLVRSVAQFWYSMALDPTVFQFWRSQMQACLDRPDAEWLLPSSSSSTIRVSDPATLKQLKHVWRTWVKCSWTLAQLTSAREQRLLSSPVHPASMRDYAKSICEHFSESLATFDQSFNSHVFQIRGEAEHLVQYGRWFNSGPVARLQPNPSMLLTRADGTCFFVVHYGTLPMEGHVFDLRREGGVKVERDMLENVAGWVESLHALLLDEGLGERTTKLGTTTRPIHIHFTFNIDHPLSYMESLTLTSTRFDVISTANSADHCGLLNLLVHSSPLLKPASPRLPHIPHVLTTSILLGNSADTRQEYVRQMLGMDLHHAPVLLGLQLLELTDGSAASWACMVDPFGFSKAYVDDLGSRSLYRFTWLACPVPSVPVSLEESNCVAEALIKVARDNCGSYMHKMIRPGGPLASGALIGTLIAYAIASNRITWADPSGLAFFSPSNPADRSSTPNYDVPTSFWNRINSVPALADTIADILIHAQLRGLGVATRCEYALHVQATFPLAFDSFPTPNLVVCFEHAGRQYLTEALRIVEINQAKKTITVAVYLPGLMSSWDAKAVRMSLQRPHVIGPGQGYYAPMGGKVWTLDQLAVEKVLVDESPWLPVMRAIAETTKKVLEARKAAEEEGSAKVVKIVDSGATLAVTLDISAYGDSVKITLPTAKQIESGHGGALIIINGQLHRFWMPSRVLLKQAKHSRKFRTADLIYTKQVHAHVPSVGMLGLPFCQRLHGLPALAPPSISEGDLGFMFSQAEEQCKRGRINSALQTPGRKTAFHVKGLVEQVFKHVIKGHKAIVFARADAKGSPLSGHLGLLLINGMYMHPPTYSGRAWTLALDVTVSVLPRAVSASDSQGDQEEYMAAIRGVLDVVVAQRAPVVRAEDNAVAVAVTELLELVSAQCGNRNELPYPLLEGKIENVPVVARRYLKRGILTSMGPAEDLVKDVFGEYGMPSQAAAHGEPTMMPSPPAFVPKVKRDEEDVPGQRPKVDPEARSMVMQVARAMGMDPRVILEQMGMGEFDL
ncbi:hypothetical protein BCR44DRAFT_73698 [Catenaria anguillulae PL171]|uniref:DUF4470 domain-containing protein n=1 Tax=Catenaria anguillulae PL171 TaxID=765915 RepID=A0A1Y2I2I8_9FUNG|nr:hypothetical protein BCR44DRAFT_73698 [Catenaria anguillulae PL171]